MLTFAEISNPIFILVDVKCLMPCVHGAEIKHLIMACLYTHQVLHRKIIFLFYFFSLCRSVSVIVLEYEHLGPGKYFCCCKTISSCKGVTQMALTCAVEINPERILEGVNMDPNLNNDQHKPPLWFGIIFTNDSIKNFKSNCSNIAAIFVNVNIANVLQLPMKFRSSQLASLKPASPR